MGHENNHQGSRLGTTRRRGVRVARDLGVLGLVAAVAACGAGGISKDTSATGGAPSASSPTGEATTASPTASAPAGPGTPQSRREGGCSAPSKLVNLPINGKFVAITFDDGPSTKATPEILDILKREGVKATFFDIGGSSEAHPELEKRAVDEGHIVANHSWTHPQLSLISSSKLTSELDKTSTAITAATGHQVCFVRPPYGATNKRVEKAILSRGMSQVLWSVDTLDWKRPGAQAIAKAALDFPVGHTANILMHAGPDGADRSQTVAALPTIISTLKQRGYRFVQVDGTAFPGEPPVVSESTATATKKSSTASSGTSGAPGSGTATGDPAMPTG